MGMLVQSAGTLMEFSKRKRQLTLKPEVHKGKPGTRHIISPFRTSATDIGKDRYQDNAFIYDYVALYGELERNGGDRKTFCVPSIYKIIVVTVL